MRTSQFERIIQVMRLFMTGKKRIIFHLPKTNIFLYVVQREPFRIKCHGRLFVIFKQIQIIKM